MKFGPFIDGYIGDNPMRKYILFRKKPSWLAQDKLSSSADKQTLSVIIEPSASIESDVAIKVLNFLIMVKSLQTSHPYAAVVRKVGLYLY